MWYNWLAAGFTLGIGLMYAHTPWAALFLVLVSALNVWAALGFPTPKENP